MDRRKAQESDTPEYFVVIHITTKRDAPNMAKNTGIAIVRAGKHRRKLLHNAT